jgi:hypothetical protein
MPNSWTEAYALLGRSEVAAELSITESDWEPLTDEVVVRHSLRGGHDKFGELHCHTKKNRKSGHIQPPLYGTLHNPGPDGRFKDRGAEALKASRASHRNKFL